MQCLKVMLTKPNFSNNSIVVKQRNRLNYGFLIRFFTFGNICFLQPEKNKFYMQENKTKCNKTTREGETNINP